VLARTYLATERAAFTSIGAFATIPLDVQRDADAFFQRLDALIGPAEQTGTATGDGAVVFVRNAAVTGPMTVFEYDYFEDHYRGSQPRLLSFQGLRGAGGEYAYEVLNLVDGKRNARDIRDVVSAEYGPVPLDVVVEYLRALETAGVIASKH
jgi:hypothetical protein